MARDREQIYEASDWFKEALQKNQVCMEHSFAQSLYVLDFIRIFSPDTYAIWPEIIWWLDGIVNLAEKRREGESLVLYQILTLIYRLLSTVFETHVCNM